MSKTNPPNLDKGYISEEFDIRDYPDNYADYYARSEGMICDKCKKVTGAFEMYYHLPTTLDFCEECVWHIEMETKRV